MDVVSNTSPILGLAAIQCLTLARQQFQRLLIPEAVLEELKVDTDFRGSAAIYLALQEGWISVIPILDQTLAQVLSLDLDRGEAEAIVLALQLGVNTILMDETEGRNKAKALGLRPIGILGILLRAKKAGYLPAIQPLIQALRQEIGFHLSETIVAAVLTEAGEQQS